MASILQPISFTNSLQQITWTAGTSQITAYLWGSGGAGGGYDSGAPGTGSGGGFARKTFTVKNGDIIQIAVGGGGGPGANSASGYGGGTPGPSFTNVWSTLSLTGSPYIRVTNPAWSGFLNTYGVWNYSSETSSFDHTVSVYFSQTGYYSAVGSCDNYATIYVDGAQVLSIPGYQTTYGSSFFVTAGTHSVRLLGTNTGGPGGIALTLTANSGAGRYSFGGGYGGNAGYSGSSGGGGGGGGATAILVNNSVVAVAGGGGGGGGGGNRNPSTGQSAPGTSGQASAGTYAGQNGQSVSGDGGGGGGGGGGYAAGNGGSVGPYYDTGGLAGYYGSCLGDYVENGNGRTPGGSTNPYYVSGVGLGGTLAGAGSNGYALLDMNLGGASVKHSGGWSPVLQSWVKYQGSWTPINSTWIKTNGSWVPVIGANDAPAITAVSGYWGADPRTF